MNKKVFLVVLLLLLVVSPVYSWTIEGFLFATGELISDAPSALHKYKCNVFLNIPKDCSVYLEDKTSGAMTDEEIGKILNQPDANSPLNDVNTLDIRSENATDRLIAMYDLFSTFFVLMFQLIVAFFYFLEVYLVLWFLFVGLPKLLNMFLTFIMRVKGL